MAFPQYLPLVRLSVGEWSDVYLAKRTGPQNEERIVILKRALSLKDQREAERRLVREAQISTLVRHPHVATALELSENDDGLVLVFDYIAGFSLDALLQGFGRLGGSLPPWIAARVFADAANGLARIHRCRTETGDFKHVVHGDVSPGNILVGEDGYARVTDLGSACFLGEVAEVWGTLPYTAPELLRGGPRHPASDVWSLAAVLLSTLLGRPWCAGTRDEQLTAIQTKGPVVPSDVPPDLRQLLLESLSPSPDRRITMRELAERLETSASVGGGGRGQLLAYVEGELGDALELRRRRLKLILRTIDKGHVGSTQVTHLTGVNQTLLESFLDTFVLPEIDGTAVDSVKVRKK